MDFQEQERKRLEWLNSLTEGAEVVVSSGYGYRTERLERVVRTTPTQIIVSAGTAEVRYSRKNGRRVGSESFHSSRLHIPTDELRAEIRKRGLAGRLESTRWGALSLETLEQVAALVKESK